MDVALLQKEGEKGGCARQWQEERRGVCCLTGERGGVQGGVVEKMVVMVDVVAWVWMWTKRWTRGTKGEVARQERQEIVVTHPRRPVLLFQTDRRGAGTSDATTWGGRRSE